MPALAREAFQLAPYNAPVKNTFIHFDEPETPQPQYTQRSKTEPMFCHAPPVVGSQRSTPESFPIVEDIRQGVPARDERAPNARSDAPVISPTSAAEVAASDLQPKDEEADQKEKKAKGKPEASKVSPSKPGKVVVPAAELYSTREQELLNEAQVRDEMAPCEGSDEPLAVDAAITVEGAVGDLQPKVEKMIGERESAKPEASKASSSSASDDDAASVVRATYEEPVLSVGGDSAAGIEAKGSSFVWDIDPALFDKKRRRLVKQETFQVGKFHFEIKGQSSSPEGDNVSFGKSGGKGSVTVKSLSGDVGQCTVSVSLRNGCSSSVTHAFAEDSPHCTLPKLFDFLGAVDPAKKTVAVELSVTSCDVLAVHSGGQIAP